MTSAADLKRYIALVVSEDLDDATAKSWYRCVRERAPVGALTSIEVSTDEGDKAAAMVKRESDGATAYMIPLTRDLMEAEATRIIACFLADHPDLDFDVEATIVRTGDGIASLPKIDVDEQAFIELCTALSKKQHDDWVTKRTEDGWRYGVKVSVSDKTHPLLRPWEDLPDQFRTVDLEQPQRLLDLLSQYGYAVVPKEDLEAVLRLVRTKK